MTDRVLPAAKIYQECVNGFGSQKMLVGELFEAARNDQFFGELSRMQDESSQNGSTND